MADVKYELANLVDDVGARLDIGDPTASTTPTNDQIEMWLNLAQLDVTSKAIDLALDALWTTQTILGADLSLVQEGIFGIWDGDLATDFFRPIKAEYWRASDTGGDLSRSRVYNIYMVHKEMAHAIIGNPLYAPTITKPIGWIWGRKFNLAIDDSDSTIPYDVDKLVISYIKEPYLMDDTVDFKYTELPHVYQDLMVKFAVIQAKIQDGKIEEIPALTAAYEQGIQMINMQAAQSYYGIRGR